MILPRVALVMEATAGGTARHLESVARGLVDRGLTPAIIASCERDPHFRFVLRDLSQLGCEVVELPMVRAVSPVVDLRLAWTLRGILRRLQPDVVHLHSSKAGALGRLARAWGAPGRVAYSPHAFAFLQEEPRLRTGMYALIEKALAFWTDCLIAVSPSEAQVAVERHLVSPRRIAVVANGVDLPTGYRDHLSAIDEHGPLRLGFLGRLEAQKEPLRLLELAGALRTRAIDFNLTIMGDGSLREPMEQRVRTMGLEDVVRLLPAARDVEPFYSRMDVFVTTSRYEGLPYAVLDAMARSLPVAGFEVPGICDCVDDGVTGVLVPFDRSDQLAERLHGLAGNAAERKRLGLQGRARVAAMFRRESQMDELVTTYQRMLRDGFGP